MVRRILLGSQLRRLREARGVTREDAGYSIRASESKISRMELGRVSFKARDVADLLTLYGVTDEAEREPLLNLAKASSVAGWWHSYSDVLPSWFQTYVGLEGAASQIDTYEVQFVHGLLQTEEYAHAVVASGHRSMRLSKEEIERRVALRVERQKILFQDDATELRCVLDDAALRRPFGSAAVMDKQLQHLIDLSERPNIHLQVVPFDLGGHPAESGAFTVLRFPEPEIPDLVYLEQLTGSLYLDKPEEVAAYGGVLDRLIQDGSLSPAETRDHLHKIRQLA
ncbi:MULTISPECIES: helix-turn-helix domain-containing protein [unclassified Streptomyces]|uniref:helix-turn-helix domain-containing protein n=1 Tax=unclassified Streptomyces TaxID=2593676 RepID=UPI0022B6FBEA|nr:MULTISPECIES: helix-turn-helix transcriptional regulator [unclassified Streptomyces]MCZ7415102.1 helix-turn-helix transcriptional regulator [Streptomyces sp. WMMC897]MCZ7432045.1 helix-turn-helix transcriptional regulator [Streptomyces sp. WMMC1477]